MTVMGHTISKIVKLQNQQWEKNCCELSKIKAQDSSIRSYGEVSQKEKNKYRILTHIYGIQKDGTDEPACREAMGDTDAENNKLMDMAREEGQGRV